MQLSRYRPEDCRRLARHEGAGLVDADGRRLLTADGRGTRIIDDQVRALLEPPEASRRQHLTALNSSSSMARACCCCP